MPDRGRREDARRAQGRSAGGRRRSPSFDRRPVRDHAGWAAVVVSRAGHLLLSRGPRFPAAAPLGLTLASRPRAHRILDRRWMSRETVVREPFVVERHALAPANAPGAVEPALRLPVLVDRHQVERETRFERQLATRTTHERIVYPVHGATRASPSRRGTRHAPAAAPRPPDLPAVLTLARPPAVTGPSGIATPSGPANSRTGESGTSASIAPATLRPAGQPPATPPGLSAAEVERLTDQVLTRIERRAVAQRERHGRH